jgi:hypothetical protein
MSDTMSKVQALFPQKLSSEGVELVALGSAREWRGLDGDLYKTNKGQLQGPTAALIATHMTLKHPRESSHLIRRGFTKMPIAGYRERSVLYAAALASCRAYRVRVVSIVPSVTKSEPQRERVSNAKHSMDSIACSPRY